MIKRDSKGKTEYASTIKANVFYYSLAMFPILLVFDLFGTALRISGLYSPWAENPEFFMVMLLTRVLYAVLVLCVLLLWPKYYRDPLTFYILLAMLVVMVIAIFCNFYRYFWNAIYLIPIYVVLCIVSKKSPGDSN
jgi:hypothetical protein